jgi:lipoate-protein ligase A
MAAWRWRQETEPGTPDGNMVADAALLREVLDDPQSLPIVRVYTWDRPCVSIGRLQDEAAVRVAFPDLPLVRRPTGGRTVRHGDDLCVAVAARLSDLPLDGSEWGVLPTFRLIAAGLMDALMLCGRPAVFGASRSPGRASAVDCFASAARCDVVNPRTGRKLIGCAQRREDGALLQQMSIPLINLPEPAAFLAFLRHSLTGRLAVSAWKENSPPAPCHL